MTQLGRYEIVKPLARGSMAELLLARATGMHAFERHVVLKQIRPELAVDEKFVRMFLDEARVAAVLHHHNIVQVYDVGEQDGAYFFAMEYVHGEDLRTVVQQVRERNEQIPFEVACQIISGAAAGLHHAHDKRGADGKPLGLVHRDVSPGNVLVAFDGAVKLVDFGLAKAALRSGATRTGSLAGKAGYMSPEQCQGVPLDRRSDVFSLGIVLYELLTTRRLFQAANEFLTMAAIVQGDVPPPSSHRPDVPRSLDEIVLRSLAKDRDARYASADELRAALERFMVDAELRTSNRLLADFMKRLFGERVEPWLAEKPVPRPPVLPEGTHDGIVAPPDKPDPKIVRSKHPTSPLAIAQALVEGTEPPQDFVGEDATTVEPPPLFGEGSAGPPRPPPPPRRDEAPTTVTPPIVPILGSPEDDKDDTTTRANTDDLGTVVDTPRARPRDTDDVQTIDMSNGAAARSDERPTLQLHGSPEDAQTTIAPPKIPPGDPMYLGPPATGVLRSRPVQIAVQLVAFAKKEPIAAASAIALLLLLVVLFVATC